MMRRISVLPDRGVLLPFTLAVVVIALALGPDMTLFLWRTLHQAREGGISALAAQILFSWAR